MKPINGFVHRTLSLRPSEDKLLCTLAEFEDRSMSAVARRLIEAEATAKREEIEAWQRTQAKKTSGKAA